MKYTIFVSAFALALIGFSGTAFPDSPRLDWLLGCWAEKDGRSREVWVRDSDVQLIGFSVALDGSGVVFHEVLSIRWDDGAIHYTAHPQGQAATTFSTSAVDPRGISFTNAGHDYPQRIDYRLNGNQLQATISLLDGSKPAMFKKEKCP